MHRRVFVAAHSTLLLMPDSPRCASTQSPSDLSAFCDSLFQSALNEKLLPGGAVAIVEDGRVPLARIYFTGYLVSALVFVGVLQQWHFIGYHY